MPKSSGNPLFGWTNTSLSQVPITTKGPHGLAALHNLGVKSVQASTMVVKNKPGKFPNGKTPKSIGP